MCCIQSQIRVCSWTKALSDCIPPAAVNAFCALVPSLWVAHVMCLFSGTVKSLGMLLTLHQTVSTPDLPIAKHVVLWTGMQLSHAGLHTLLTSRRLGPAINLASHAGSLEGLTCAAAAPGGEAVERARGAAGRHPRHHIPAGLQAPGPRQHPGVPPLPALPGIWRRGHHCQPLWHQDRHCPRQGQLCASALSQADPELAARKAIRAVLGLREPSPVTGPVSERPLTCSARERTEGICGFEASIIPDRAYMSTEMSSGSSQLH